MLFEIKEFLDMIATPAFLASGRRPWTPGYYTARKRTICAAIDNRFFHTDINLPTGYGARIDERAVEYPWVFAHLNDNPGKILDAGSALNYRFLLDRNPLKNAQLTIMTLAPEKRCFWNNSISYVFGDLRQTYFSDAAFDVVVSISTIEHIGLDNTLLYTGDASKKESDVLGFVAAIREFRRILKPGGLCLITVPYGRRGVYGWYQIFDADLVRCVIETFQPSDYAIDYFGYGKNEWYRTAPDDIANAEFFDAQAGLPLPADSAAGARGVACMRLVA